LAARSLDGPKLLSFVLSALAKALEFPLEVLLVWVKTGWGFGPFWAAVRAGCDG
jgi:hypothetical protein